MRVVIIVAVFASMLAVPSSAQISVTAADLPAYFGSGTSWYQWYIDEADILFDVGEATAANAQTWTLPEVAWTDSMVTSSVDPGSTPYHDRFPGAVYAQLQSTSDEGYSLTFYHYFGISQDSVLRLGGASRYVVTETGSEMDTTIFDDEAHLIMALPVGMGWGTSSSDSVSFGQDMYSKTTRSSLVDAYGTLVLPFGSFQALRLKEVEQYSVYISGNSIVSPPEYSYSWFTKEGHRVDMEADTNQPGSGTIRIRSISLTRSVQSTPVSVPPMPGTPATFTLGQNYPNPFNPATRISIGMQDAGLATLKVFDVLGREVATLVNDHLGAGMHTFTFNASELPSGTYVYVLRVGGEVMSKKMVLMQ